MFLNNTPQVSGTFVSNAGGVPTGYVNLYEMNVDRQSSQLIYPFVTKEGSLTSFSTISTTNFNNDFAFGDSASFSKGNVLTISVQPTSDINDTVLTAVFIMDGST